LRGTNSRCIDFKFHVFPPRTEASDRLGPALGISVARKLFFVYLSLDFIDLRGYMMILPCVAILAHSAIATPAIPPQSGQIGSAEFQSIASTTQVQTYPETADGLHNLIQRLATAIQRGNSEEITTLTHSLIIPNFQEWLPQVFGTEIGAHMAQLYEESVPDFDAKFKESVEHMVKNGQTDINVTRFEGPELSEKDFYAVKLVKAMQNPVPIYAVKMNKPGETAWSIPGFFVFVQGNFRTSDTSDGTPWARFQTCYRGGSA
jgi:hypothetical protein